MPPFLFHRGPGRLHSEGSALGTGRLTHQPETRLVGKAVRFHGINIAATSDDILPSRAPAALAGNDMVEGKFGRGTPLAGVLAGIAVANKNILPVEPDFRNRKTIELPQQENLRDENTEPHGAYVRAGAGAGGLRKLNPLGGIHRSKITANRVDNPRMSLPEKGKGATNPDNVNRLPVSVEDKNTVPVICPREFNTSDLKRHLREAVHRECAAGTRPVNAKAGRKEALPTMSHPFSNRRSTAYFPFVGMPSTSDSSRRFP